MGPWSARSEWWSSVCQLMVSGEADLDWRKEVSESRIKGRSVSRQPALVTK